MILLISVFFSFKGGILLKEKNKIFCNNCNVLKINFGMNQTNWSLLADGTSNEWTSLL